MRALELKARLDSGDTDFLRETDPGKAAEALALGEGAAFYLSRHAEAAGNAALAEALLEVCFERDASLWKKEAGARLAHQISLRAISEKDLPFLKSWRAYHASPEASLALIRAFEAAENLDAVAEEIAFFEKEFPDQGDLPTGLHVALTKAKLQRFSGKPEWIDTALSVALSPNPDAPVPEACGLLVAAGEALDSLPESTVLGLKLRWHIARKDYAAAAALAKTDRFPDARTPHAVLADAGKAWLYGSGASEGVKRLEAFLKSPDISREAAFTARFYLGRLYRELGKHAESAKSLLEAALGAGEPKQKDAALWYHFDALSRRGKSYLLESVVKNAGFVSNPAHFTDLFERLCTDLAAAGDFASLDRLRTSLSPASATPDVRARLAYATGRACQEGLLPGGKDGAETRFREAISAAPRSFYYELMATTALGETAVIGKPREASTGENRARNDAETILDGFPAWGLLDALHDEISARLPRVSDAALRRYAGILAKGGFHADAIRTVSALERRGTSALSVDDLKIWFPRPYQGEIEAASRESGIPVHVLYALIRTESAFLSDVVSRAGAVGLSQLMPATAEQTAKAMRLAEWSITDPEDNVRIGARYLADMERRLGGNLLLASFAYNGGISRVRKWKSASPELPNDLFLETIPFEETRNYGRKVLAAASIYGYLYHGLDPASVARSIANGNARE